MKSPIAREAIERIGVLYQIETQIRGQSPEARRAARQQYAMPLLNALHAWMIQTVCELDSSSTLLEAFNYSLKRWSQLCRYTEDGRLEIDNGAAERSIRGMGIGRRYARLAIMRCPAARASHVVGRCGARAQTNGPACRA